MSRSALQSTAESTFDDPSRLDLPDFSTLPTESIAEETINTLARALTAEAVQTAQPVIETPSIRKILSYTLPAIGVWMCSPILSMIDTAAVGMLAGTAQQAALNPAVSVTDYGGLVVVS